MKARYFALPAYCPRLLQPDFSFPKKAEAFTPFHQYLGGFFLFQTGQEFTVMDALGHALAGVRAKSASLVQSSIAEDGKAKLQIHLQYDSCSGVQKIPIGTCDPPPKPPEPSLAGYKKTKKGFFRGSGLKNAARKMVIPAIYDDISGFLGGYAIATSYSYSTYFDPDGQRLVLFMRRKDDFPDSEDRVSIYCSSLKEATFFQDGIAVVKTCDGKNRRYVIASSGRCLGDRGWDEAGPICGGLIPVFSRDDGGWTLMNRAGELLGAYYERVIPTPCGAAFVLDGGVYRCIVPFGGRAAIPLRWQHIQEAEPGLLWALRDGQHELIDCRANRAPVLNMYSDPIRRPAVWTDQKHSGLSFLRPQNQPYVRMSFDDFFQYIDFLQQNLGMRCCLTAMHATEEGRHILAFEGGRLFSPMGVTINGAHILCSLIIVYRQTEHSICFYLAARSERAPYIPPADETGMHFEDRIILDPDLIQKISSWNSDHDNSFCDYLHVDLDQALESASKPYEMDDVDRQLLSNVHLP